MPKVTIVLNVWGGDALRMDITRECLLGAFENAGYQDYEVLACDNGSHNKELHDLVRSLPNLVYFKINKENRGNYQALNQSLLRATSDSFCVIDPDIELPKNWLVELVRHNQAIENSGVSGIHTVAGAGKLQEHAGLKVMARMPGGIFGTKFWNRRLMNEIGYFCEDYGIYGFGDADFSKRARLAGFLNYYIEGLSAKHLGHDVGQKNEFRQIKDRELKNSKKASLTRNSIRYREGDYYIPAPEENLNAV